MNCNGTLVLWNHLYHLLALNCVENPKKLMNDTKEISIEKEGRNKNNFQTFAKVILALFLYFLEIVENVTFK